MRNSAPFKGLGVAVVTPFYHDAIDFASLAKIIEHAINEGVDYIVSLGTTGEPATMKQAERFKVLDYTIEKVGGRVPVVAGFGGNDTKAIIEQMGAYHFDGIDGILSNSPAYNKPTQEGIFQHFMAIAESAPRPIVLYNVPGRTASNMEAETTLRLAESSEQFVAIKEASGNIAQCGQIIRNAPEGFALLSGDDALALPLIACGAEGLISVIANALPRAFAELVHAAQAGDFDQARKIHLALLPLHHWLFAEGNPAGVKAAMHIKGILGSMETRLPLVPVSEACYARLHAHLKDIG
jgi:4-hydroxy-tetrahydrodipicolinate synthase